ncbi:fumarylacetoacetase [Xylophilus sp. Leaf220]|uniref:fumarylacetoacetase n=1 Tax=Xylophilus sp. Leaf220 TaxID=1735686 RepID=UPI0006F5F62F|nr:fumarylacetoacetase [Xylophilus sp. Leaf220]KQM78204.1 fumarylacetoacetase [Xylophilus sp. Leaf220]
MTARIDRTHDAALQSWVSSANADGTDFPIQNLPLGIFRRAGSAEAFRPGTAIGDQVVDLLALVQAGQLAGEAAAALAGTEDGSLNALMARGRAARVALRQALSDGLRTGAAAQSAWQAALVPQAEAEYAVPARIGDYTDFYTSVYHATSIGRMFRPDNPLLPNYKWVPIGYHGRSSSIGISGQQFPRPVAQLGAGGTDGAPRFGPCERLDYELEMAIYVGTANPQGEPVPMAEAEDHLFGLGLLNDWSARDIQAWEYQPLGPFLSKNFASTVSPWIVTLEALEPFRAAFARPEGDPQPLPYLDSEDNRTRGALDLQLEVWLQTPKMRADGQPHQRLMRSNFKDSYWTIAQLLSHHTVGGCNLQPGDMLGSGTQSGPTPDQGGSMLELSGGGKQPLVLANGETRAFLQDGDSVMLRARGERDGFRTVGFGECEGRVLPARRADRGA